MNSIAALPVLSKEQIAPGLPSAEKRVRLDSLQVFRGVAAVLVVLHHMGTFSLGHFGAPFLGNSMEWGASGVDFFFVLSGFIIYFVHRGDLGQPSRLRAFVLKRLVRIYPIYWVACAVVIPLYFLSPYSGPSYARNPMAILTSIFLIPQAHFPVLGQAWTLTFELLFYAIFSLLIARYRMFVWPVTAWMALCLGIYFFDLGRWFAGFDDVRTILVFPWDWLFSRHNVLFGAGVAAAALVTRPKGIRFPQAVLWSGILLFGIFAALNQPGRSFDLPLIFDYPLTFGLASTLIVIGAAGLDLAERGARVPRMLLYVGNASYSIYLFHSLVLSLAIRPAEKLVAGHHLGVNAAGCLLCVLAVGAGCAVHSLIEQPLLRFLRPRLSLRGA